MATAKISLPTAILININVMIGAGIFVNTVLLSQSSGMFGALVYGVVGVLLLPLIFTFVQLLRTFHGGSFYEFASALHPIAGFVSAFSYFFAKLASCALGIHVFVTIMQQAFPALSVVPPLVFDGLLIGFFVFLNMFNVKIGSTIQYGFLGLKLIPILFAILSGLYLMSGQPDVLPTFPIKGIVASIPFVLYAFSGFEVCCSISRNIVNPQRNGPLAILISFVLGVGIVVLYQSMFYASLGTSLVALDNYSQAFPALLNKLVPHGGAGKSFLSGILNMGIASSSLGAAYGIMYSNAWNFFGLAHHKAVPMHTWFSRLSAAQVPFLVVILEGVVAMTYLLLSQGNQVPLQQICSLGVTTTYFLSSVALMVIALRAKQWQRLIVPVLAIFSSTLLIGAFINNLRFYSAWPAMLFCLLIGAGTVGFMMRGISK